MRPECIQATVTALGRDLVGTESRDIEQRIQSAMRTIARTDPDAWLAKSRADRLAEAGQFAAKELAGEAALKRQRVALQAAAHARVSAGIADLQTRGVDALNALDRMVAFHADGKANGLSVETQAKAIHNDAIRQMLDTLTASNPKWFGLFENKDGVRAIMREIFGEDSGSPEAKKGAAEWHKVAEALRERFNRSGGDIGKLDNWGMPHHHSQLKVAKAGVDAWVADILPRLDRDAYTNETGARMSDAELVDFLRGAWKTIATGGANKLTPGQFKGGGARANRGNAQRQIHFRDADSYLDYQKNFGDRTPYEVMVNHIAGVAKDIALVETFGPNPDHTFRFFKDTAVKELLESDSHPKPGKVHGQALRSEQLYDVVAGRSAAVERVWLAKGADTLRSWLTAAKLGSAVITSFSDDATMHLTAHVNELPEMQLIRNELAALNPANKMEERMALRAGLALNTLISSLNRFGEEGLGASFAKKLASTTLRASGLNALTEARRRAFGVTAMSSIGSIVREHDTLTALDAADKRLLKSRGITKQDFDVWKAAKLEDWGGGNDTMLTPDAIYRLTDRDLQAVDPKADPQVLREQAATRLLGIVLEETDVAVIEPGAAERAFMGAGLQRGSWKGELMRSFFLFKSFPLAMLTRHWTRGMSMPNRGGKAKYLGSLFAATTVLGALSLQVNEVLSGRDPRNLNPFKEFGVRNWLQAMLKGGSLGIYGDFLFSDRSSYGRSLIADFTGPVGGIVNDLDNLTRGNAFEAAAGKDTHIGAETVRLVKGNLPGANLWYSKAILDHMFFHQLQEYFSPGYLRQMRKRAQTEFGQRFWWEPGEEAPDRAPDLGAVAGE